MKNIQKKAESYKSFEDYKKKYYPTSSKKQLLLLDDPIEYGSNLAIESLKKISHMLLRK